MVAAVKGRGSLSPLANFTLSVTLTRIIHEAWASIPFNALSVGKAFQRKDGSQFTRPVSLFIPERITLVGKSLAFENMTPVVVNNSGLNQRQKGYTPGVVDFARNHSLESNSGESYYGNFWSAGRLIRI